MGITTAFRKLVRRKAWVNAGVQMGRGAALRVDRKMPQIGQKMGRNPRSQPGRRQWPLISEYLQCDWQGGMFVEDLFDSDP